MADDLKNKGPQDRSKISLTEKWEVEYLTTLLGCTEADLREAVEKMGNSVQVIKDYYFK
ncbi:MAG: DUF3606 domain-containing protein [Bacteroidetes bacterium]|nr:DUF3606 domain-containing protein [Bacteroidota bacterium]